MSEGDSFTRPGVVRHACRLRRDGTRRFLVWRILSHALERLHEGVRGGFAATGSDAERRLGAVTPVDRQHKEF